MLWWWRVSLGKKHATILLTVKIALITPLEGDSTYSSDTILDGCIQLKKQGKRLEFFVSAGAYRQNLIPYAEYALPESRFISFARNADLILLFWCKKNTDFKLAEEINAWHKTVYIDDSELGGNTWRDFTAQRDILAMQYRGGFGGVDEKMLRLCALYFRKEKPYFEGVVTLPYGITSAYRENYRLDKKKDIDFFCVWGQDGYPLMRRYTQELLIQFCNKKGFTCYTTRTRDRCEFQEMLSRSKVGISVSGSCFDTARFWEVLGNNCLLLTEKIDIYQPDSHELDYKRIYQFNNLYDFEYQLGKVGKFLREEYEQTDLLPEYRTILARHSSEARVLQILSAAKERGIIDISLG